MSIWIFSTEETWTIIRNLCNIVFDYVTEITAQLVTVYNLN